MCIFLNHSKGSSLPYELKGICLKVKKIKRYTYILTCNVFWVRGLSKKWGYGSNDIFWVNYRIDLGKEKEETVLSESKEVLLLHESGSID